MSTIVSNLTSMAFTLLVWICLNGLIFIVPGLGWVQYALLLSIESLGMLFIGSSVYDAASFKPFQDASYNFNKFRMGGTNRMVVIEGFTIYLKNFGLLAIVWSLELILQKVLFSTIFTMTLHKIDDEEGPFYWKDADQPDFQEVPLACMDGTYLFSIRQLSIILVFFFTAAMDSQICQENTYLMRIFFPMTALAIGAFMAVLNNTSKVGAGPVFVAIFWLVLRAARLILIKRAQRAHMDNLTITRFLRLLIPLMLLILIPTFFGLEYNDLGSITIKSAEETYSDAEQFTKALEHMTKVFVYGSLFYTSLVLLFKGGNAVDYNSLLIAREVIWNSTCAYIVSGSIMIPHKLSVIQMVGLSVFLVAWIAYIFLYWHRFVSRNSEGQWKRVQEIQFTSIKDSDSCMDPIVASTSQKYSDIVSNE